MAENRVHRAVAPVPAPAHPGHRPLIRLVAAWTTSAIGSAQRSVAGSSRARRGEPWRISIGHNLLDDLQVTLTLVGGFIDQLPYSRPFNWRN